MSERIITIDKDNFEETISQDKISLVDFWAEWCGPCKMLLPVIEEVAEEIGDKVNVCKLNVDQNGDLARQYSVMTIPTMIFFKNGEVIEKTVGFKPKAQILKMIEKLNN